MTAPGIRFSLQIAIVARCLADIDSLQDIDFKHISRLGGRHPEGTREVVVAVVVHVEDIIGNIVVVDLEAWEC
jgi:hypothetical protein